VSVYIYKIEIKIIFQKLLEIAALTDEKEVKSSLQRLNKTHSLKFNFKKIKNGR
jgi:hypothetical protein